MTKMLGLEACLCAETVVVIRANEREYTFLHISLLDSGLDILIVSSNRNRAGKVRERDGLTASIAMRRHTGMVTFPYQVRCRVRVLDLNSLFDFQLPGVAWCDPLHGGDGALDGLSQPTAPRKNRELR
jgi:hypothetical protein